MFTSLSLIYCFFFVVAGPHEAAFVQPAVLPHAPSYPSGAPDGGFLGFPPTAFNYDNAGNYARDVNENLGGPCEYDGVVVAPSNSPLLIQLRQLLSLAVKVRASLMPTSHASIGTTSLKALHVRNV
jgi:hypothetical protein